MNDRGRNFLLGPVKIWFGKWKEKYPNFQLRHLFAFYLLFILWLCHGGLSSILIHCEVRWSLYSVNEWYKLLNICGNSRDKNPSHNCLLNGEDRKNLLLSPQIIFSYIVYPYNMNYLKGGFLGIFFRTSSIIFNHSRCSVSEQTTVQPLRSLLNICTTISLSCGDDILERHFYSRFLGLNSNRVLSDSSFCLVFYPHFSVIQNSVHE